jgi:triosephosphate isomerase (TIM)
MSAAIRPLIAGNWKMNGLAAALGEAKAVAAGAGTAADVMICPPATLLARMADVLKGSSVAVGGQDCHAKESGAHTGDLSAQMLKDAGASAVILGHSERRSDHGETSKEVRAKVEAAHRAGLMAIVCIGETAGERHYGLTLKTVARQLKDSLPDGVTAANTVIAYEPVWAIGTGLTPTVQDVRDVHAAIRAALAERYAGEGQNMRILYGGSVKPSNAAELMSVAHVNGALVGGASLKAADFLGIIAASAKSA